MKTNSSALIIPQGTPGATNSAVAADIRDIRAPVDIPQTWLWVACALAVLLGLLAAAYAWHRWKKHMLSLPAVPPVPPHRRARERLTQALGSMGDPYLFCSLISSAIRDYLEEQFELRAPERTTEEFIQELTVARTLQPSQKAALEAFLQQCDLVKFARAEPPETDLQRLHTVAMVLIDETEPGRPVSTPPVATGSEGGTSSP